MPSKSPLFLLGDFSECQSSGRGKVSGKEDTSGRLVQFYPLLLLPCLSFSNSLLHDLPIYVLGPTRYPALNNQCSCNNINYIMWFSALKPPMISSALRVKYKLTFLPDHIIWEANVSHSKYKYPILLSSQILYSQYIYLAIFIYVMYLHIFYALHKCSIIFSLFTSVSCALTAST